MKDKIVSEPRTTEAVKWWNIPGVRWNALLEQREEQIFLALTLLIGVVVGLAVVAFILLTERTGMRLYPPGSPVWRRVMVPIVGSLAMGYFLYRYFPDARGSGVPQTKAALFVRDGHITLGTVLGKFFCTSTTLACGIPLGREGPSVQVGAGIASVLGRKLGLRPEKVKALIPIGASAAIAAAFNTPLAAVLFSLEEVMGDLHAPVLGSVVLASATSWATLRLLLGNNPLFHVPQYELVHPAEFGVYALLGIAGGLLSAAFSKLLLIMRKHFLLLPKKTRWCHPVAGGVLVGLMGWFVPQTLGVGYGYVGDALHGGMVIKLMLILLVFKFFAVTVSYASGNAGVIFAPSLFLGAMLGGAMGTAAHYFFPLHTAASGAYALVGMGTVFAGVVRAPMTSVVMIFEVTRDYTVIVPLMISNMVSFFISSRLQHDPIYEELAHQDGIHLPVAKARGRDLHTVLEAMRPVGETLSAHTPIPAALENVRNSHFNAWPVFDDGQIVGVLNRTGLEQAITSGAGQKKIHELLTTLDFPHVHRDQPLYQALERMGSAQVDMLPVVSRADVHMLEGIVVLRDILDSYGVDSSGAA